MSFENPNSGAKICKKGKKINKINNIGKYETWLNAKNHIKKNHIFQENFL